MQGFGIASRDNAYQFDGMIPSGALRYASGNLERSLLRSGSGNRERAAHGTLTLPGTDNYTADTHNQYTATPYPTAPAHDADGNTTARDVPGTGIDTTTLTAATNLIWDGENRLRSITYNGTTEHFDYDYLGRRTRRTSPQDTHFHYDGWNLIAKSYATSTPVCTYTWGTDLSGTMGGAGGVGGLLATRAAGTDYYPLYDANGNACQYIDANGNYAARYEYDAFGRMTYKSADTWSDEMLHRFSTKIFDTGGTGLYDYGYRFYDTVAGRWLKRDPIGERGGVNLYSFIGNVGPLGFDVLGLSCEDDEMCTWAEYKRKARRNFQVGTPEFAFSNTNARRKEERLVEEEIKKIERLRRSYNEWAEAASLASSASGGASTAKGAATGKVGDVVESVGDVVEGTGEKVVDRKRENAGDPDAKIEEMHEKLAGIVALNKRLMARRGRLYAYVTVQFEQCVRIEDGLLIKYVWRPGKETFEFKPGRPTGKHSATTVGPVIGFEQRLPDAMEIRQMQTQSLEMASEGHVTKDK